MTRTIEQMIAEIEASRRAAGDEADEQRLVLAASMQSAGVKHVTIYFSGYGDSGNIDDPQITMLPGHDKPVDLERQLLDWADKFLEGTGVDWYNNEGGQGEIEFDLTTTPPTFRAHVNINIVTTETAFQIEEGA